MKKIFSLLEQGFTVISLLFLSGGLLILIISGGAAEADVEVTYDTSLIRLVYSLIYIVIFFLLIMRWNNVVTTIKKDIYIWALVSLAFFSIFWSFAPGTTIKDSIAILGSSIFGLYLATRYSIEQQLKLLGYMFGISIFLSIIFAILIPQLGQMHDLHLGAWRGIYIHKNGLGTIMTISTIVFLFLALENKKTWILWFLLSLSLFLLVMAKSSSAIVNFLNILLALLILKFLKLPYYLMVPLFILLMLIGYISSLLVMDDIDKLAGLIGKDPTLTGRTFLWGFVWDMIQKHPWIGYGYGGFWQGWDGEAAYVWRSLGWNPSHPHNGLLALWLDLGLLGVLIFLIGFGKSIARAFVWIRLSRTLGGFWPMTHCIYLVLVNLTESNLFSTNNIVWVLYVACACSTLTAPQQGKLV